jgi:large subunit ribosomal protein L4
MAKAAVLGKTTKAELPKELFAEPFHHSLVHETARADMASRRRGTASTLTRGEVAFTTAKAWRQKGTGRDRKARRKAMRSALSVHAERGSVAVLDASAFETPSTRSAAEALDKWGARRPTLVVIDGEEIGALKSFRNIARVTVAEVGAIAVADVIGAASLVVSEKALAALEGRLG